MSKRRYLTDPPQTDAISGPDRIQKDNYSNKYRTYKKSLLNYKKSIRDWDITRDKESVLRKEAYNRAIEKTGSYGTKRFRQIYDSYPGLNDAIYENSKAKDNYDIKQREYDNASKALGQATIDKYRGTKYDVLAADNWGGEKYLASLGVRESRGAQEVADYFNSYANSPGIDRIINNQGKQVSWIRRGDYIRSAKDLKRSIRDYPLSNIGVFDVDRFAEGGINIYKGAAVSGTGKPLHVIINEDKPFVKDDYEYWFTLPHELMHDYNYIEGGQREGLNRNQNTSPGHDSRLNEKHSDLEALRYMLYKYGIYDSRGDKDATPSDIQKLRDKYPDIRPLKQMDNEKAAWMINNVADNTTKKKKHLDIYYA